MSADFLLQIAKTSLFTSLLIGILLLLVPLLQKRYRAKWRYVAWIVIAVRLLIPVDLSLPESPIRIELPEQSVEIVAPLFDNAEPQMESATDLDAQTTPVPANPTMPSAAPQTDKAPLSPLQIIGFVWLAGVLVFLLFQLCAYQVFLRKLKASHMETVPASIQETVWRLGVEMGICKLPEPIVTDAIDAPVLIGVLHPRILLPHTRYTNEETAFILRHELIHYRRRDMWYKLVLLLANALHWFNPLVYLMTVQAAKDIELACDDDVIRELGRDARARYGDTILSALPRKRRLEPVFSTHFGSNRQNMKIRLRNLFDTTTKRRGIAALCAVVVCAVVVTGVATVGYAAAKPSSIPTITGEFPFSIPSIKAGEVVCIGKVEMGPGISYTATMSVESGDGWMMGMTDSPDITRHAGTAWNNHFGRGSQYYFASEKLSTLYIYVGSQADSGTILTNVTGKLISRSPIGGQDFPSAPALTGLSVSIRASNSTWAAATEVTGNTYQAQLDKEIRWLEDAYKENNTRFVISETIPENEIYDKSGIEYLYNTSEAYRSMSQMTDASFQLADGGSFSRSGLPSGRVYDRTAVMVDSAATLTLDARCSLNEGKMGVWLINPSGNVAHMGDAVTSYSEVVTLHGAKGLWSVITVSEAENGAVSGTSKISLKVADGNAKPEPAKPTPSSNFAVQSLGQHSLENMDTLEVNLRWSGKGNVMLLYTDKSYTNEEILVPLQGMPGVPKPDYNKVDQNQIGSIFNFSASAKSPLVREPKVTKSGSYYFYIVQYDFDTFNNVSGNVTIGKANGYSSVIWQSEPEKKDSDNTVSTVGEDTVFLLRNNNGQKSITQSGSFEAKAGQNLILAADSNIKGGSVDFFLFSPAGNGLNETTRFTIGGSDTIKTIELSAGTWAYNCTGFFDSGSITITGKLSGVVRAKSTAADKAAYEVMQYSRSWTMVEYMLPYMTKEGIDAAVQLNNELNPNGRKTASDYYGLATPSKSESDQTAYALMENSGNWTYSSPLFPYMTNGGIDRVVALYIQKTGKQVRAAEYYN